MATQIGSAPTAEVTAFTAAVRARYPMHDRYVAASLGGLTAPEMAQLDGYLSFCRSQGLSLDEIAAAYLTVVHDTLREQLYFRRRGAYRHSRFSEVASSVYFNEAYMAAYMYGLAISSFLWPNHLEIFRFFNRSLPTTERGAYLEIGPGHGYFMRTAMDRSAYDSFLGVDISAASISQTRNLLEYFAPGAASRAQLVEQDFLDSRLEAGAYAAVVMGEVLEHV